MFDEIQSELIPTENEGVLIGVGVGPSSANLSYLERFSLAFNDLYHDLPESEAYGLFNGIALTGATNAMSWVLLKPRTQRKRTEDQIRKP